ncbi:MAG: hypothetical protein QOD41_3520, partial [Cryptosporangiaceae bacterium]|nr:hypothetical protein [Cryptosporangiaceae bacterium]
GAPTIRLRWAAVGTAIMAVSVLISAAGLIMDPNHTPNILVEGRQIARSVAALSYLAAFVPPSWLRRRWSASAAFEAGRHLLDAPPTERPETTWQRYAAAVCDTAGADAAVVVIVADDGTVTEVAHARLAAGPDEPPTAAQVEELLAATQPVDTARPDGRRFPQLAAQYAGRGGARFVTAVPLTAPSDQHGALVLVNQHRSLFSDDDIRLLASLGTQAAILAERGTVLAEQARLTTELAESVDALQRASKAKSDFLASMSHELRTPLNSIIGFSELMRAEDAQGDHRVVPDEWIEHVHSSGRRLLALINDILDLTKVEAGRLELRLEPVELPALVHEAVSALGPVADRKNLDLDYDVPAIAVTADRIRLRQCLDNLLSNAIKFTPDGGRILVTARAEPTTVVVTVADSGAGIALADQERVFEEFQQVGDPTVRTSGTGLGLALTRRLVQAHGGKIDLRSELGQGAEFSMHLPRVSDEGAVPAPAKVRASSAATHTAGGILVIEDGAGAVRLLRTYLEEAGYTVTVAPDGESGLELAARIRPEAIILDVLLPGVGGWEVLRRLKSDPVSAAIPVIIATVVDEQETGRSLGAADYFVKPIERERLIRCVSQYVTPAPELAAAEKVLVIDDDSSTLRVVDTALKQQGYHVVTAASGAEGLRIARNQDFGLIICDLLMPDMDGFAVIAALEADPAREHPPIVVFTGKDLTATDRERLAGRTAGVIRKGDDGPTALRQWLDWAYTRPIPVGGPEPAVSAHSQGAST